MSVWDGGFGGCSPLGLLNAYRKNTHRQNTCLLSHNVFRFLASINRLSFLYFGIRLVAILVLVFLFVQNALAKA